jgi:hypothetical protein
MFSRGSRVVLRSTIAAGLCTFSMEAIAGRVLLRFTGFKIALGGIHVLLRLCVLGRLVCHGRCSWIVSIDLLDAAIQQGHPVKILLILSNGQTGFIEMLAQIEGSVFMCNALQAVLGDTVS